MRVWIDVSNSPQVHVFRPLIALLQEDGHTVEITTRDYAQTLELLELHELPHRVIGPGHGGRGRLRKALTMARRVAALRGFARGGRFDRAVSHASHELPLVARSLGLPSVYAFDYEFARIQHGIGARAARRVVVPEAIPQERLDRLGARRHKVRRYPGLKEEYYLAGFQPREAVLDELRLDRARILVVVRPPPEISLYHRHGNPLVADVLQTLGSDPTLRAVVLPRTRDQRDQVRALRLPSLVVPDRAVDARSLVALADLVISAGGTMNREAAALGVPAFTTFAGALGAVDERLVAEGRLRVLHSTDELEPVKRDGPRPQRVERDPRALLELLFDP